MESTGKYYVPVYNALEGHISNVVVANPKWVRCIKGEKDDNSDIFGKISSAIINTILSQNEYNDEDILKNVQKNCKSSNEDILILYLKYQNLLPLYNLIFWG